MNRTQGAAQVSLRADRGTAHHGLLDHQAAWIRDRPRIAVDRHEIGRLSRLDRADTVIQMALPGGVKG